MVVVPRGRVLEVFLADGARAGGLGAPVLAGLAVVAGVDGAGVGLPLAAPDGVARRPVLDDDVVAALEALPRLPGLLALAVPLVAVIHAAAARGRHV